MTYPWSAIGRYTDARERAVDGSVLFTEQGHCTGTIVEDNHVLIGAHCVYNHSAGSWRQSDPVFRPGQNEYDGLEYTNVTFIQVYERYIQRKNTTLDVAILTLERDVAPQTGTFGVGSYPPDAAVYRDRLHVTGYPTYSHVTYNETMSSRELWDLAGRGEGTAIGFFAFSDCWATDLCHDVDTGSMWGELTSPGMSGGPIWRSGADDRPELISILSQGPGGTLPNWMPVIQSSIAVRMTGQKLDDIGAMIARGNTINGGRVAGASVDVDLHCQFDEPVIINSNAFAVTVTVDRPDGHHTHEIGAGHGHNNVSPAAGDESERLPPGEYSFQAVDVDGMPVLVNGERRFTDRVPARGCDGE